MENLRHLEDGIIAPKGFKATGVSCGLKNGGSKDISLLVSSKPCNIAMAFTNNKIQGAHITVDKERKNNTCSAILVNSGIANCLTGQEGIDNARVIVSLTEDLLNIPEGSCLLASTGSIGQALNMTRIRYGIDRLVNVINTENNLRHFCAGIMTSCARHKSLAYEFDIDGKKAVIGISAKGDSMIKPWLETMEGTLLVFVTTDVNISQLLLQKALKETLDNSFNRISIDNDTSPNDSVFILANGCLDNRLISDSSDPNYKIFLDALKKIMMDMAKLLIKQGLGVTKLVHLIASKAQSKELAESVVRTVAESYQVKTALFGSKPPWDKIVNAVACADKNIDITRIEIIFNEYVLFSGGKVDTSALSSCLSNMSAMDCSVEIKLNSGNESAFLWTCDLTHDYVKVNSHVI